MTVACEHQQCPWRTLQRSSTSNSSQASSSSGHSAGSLQGPLQIATLRISVTHLRTVLPLLLALS